MAQIKGKTGNPYGRPKGSPNKVTSDLREWINDILQKNRKQVQQDLKKADSKTRLYFYEKLLQYVLPKQQAITGDIRADLNRKEEQPELDLSLVPTELLEQVVYYIRKANGTE